MSNIGDARHASLLRHTWCRPHASPLARLDLGHLRSRPVIKRAQLSLHAIHWHFSIPFEVLAQSIIKSVIEWYDIQKTLYIIEFC